MTGEQRQNNVESSKQKAAGFAAGGVKLRKSRSLIAVLVVIHFRLAAGLLLLLLARIARAAALLILARTLRLVALLMLLARLFLATLLGVFFMLTVHMESLLAP